MSESIEMCKIVHFYGFPRPKFKVHDFAIRCMNFSSHFEHLICHIKHCANILARQMIFRGPVPDACIEQFLKFRHWFYA